MNLPPKSLRPPDTTESVNCHVNVMWIHQHQFLTATRVQMTQVYDATKPGMLATVCGSQWNVIDDIVQHNKGGSSV